MRVEWYAVVVTLVGVALWLRGSVLGSVLAVLFFTIFGGGAAFIVGGASITPASFAIVFVLAHLLLSMFTKSDHTNRGLKSSAYLIWFCIYAAATAYILPRMLMNVTHGPSLSLVARPGTSATVPLHYSKQNITAAIYLIGVMLLSICAGAASADPKSRQALVRWAIIIAWIHIFFGVLGTLGASSIIKFFRNATYAELVQTEEGYSRVTGIFPEPSAYAGYAFPWFVLMTELWLRNVSPRLTFFTALALAVMLIACTSTSGYAAMALYGLVMAGRFIIAPRSFSLAKAIPVAAVLTILVAAGLAACAFYPHLTFIVGRVIRSLTVGKVDTLSGRQRLYDVQSALDAVKATWGVGVGAGSFRSSGLLFAIAESTGVVGLAVFLAHFFNILKPWRRDTYALPGERRDAIAVAASWAACAGLIPAILTASSAVPTYVFVVLGGLALGWRYSARLSPAVATWPRPVSRGYAARPPNVV
jgi:hypothetical protein